MSEIRKVGPIARAGLIHTPPPGSGDDVMMLAMRVGPEVRPGLLKLDSESLVLADVDAVQPSMNFAMVECQTCTMYMSIEGSFDVSTDRPANVNVRLGQDPVSGRPMIIIS